MGFWFAYLGIYGGGGSITGHFVAGQVYQHAIIAGDVHADGDSAGQVYQSGIVTGDVR